MDIEVQYPLSLKPLYSSLWNTSSVSDMKLIKKSKYMRWKCLENIMLINALNNLQELINIYYIHIVIQ